MRDGVTFLRGAFDREVAALVRERVWKATGLSPDKPGAWKEPVVHVREVYKGEPFSGIVTPRLLGALDDLLGEGCYFPPDGFGWWPVAFPGFDRPPWKAPETGWHVDGIQFHHHVNSRDQGLLPLFFLSDIRPGDGGTAVSLGSHIITAKILAAAEPAGLDIQELCRRVLSLDKRERPLEATGQAGDVALIHPFMLHSRSPNTGDRVRFICNPCIMLREAMSFDRPRPEDHSPVERAIRRALGKD